MFWLTALSISLCIYAILITGLAKRKVFISASICWLPGYIIILSMYEVFYSWCGWNAFLSSLFLSILQTISSMLAVEFWRRFHGTAPTACLPLVAPMFPIGAEVVRLLTF